MLFTCVRTILGILLAVTAVLKLHLLLTDPFADIKTGSSFPILWLAVFVEAAVVYVVFSTQQNRFKWRVLLVLFTVLSVVSAYNVLSGKTNCGCAGAVDIHPVWLLAFDLSAIVSLLVCRPAVQPTCRLDATSWRIDWREHSGLATGLLVFAAFMFWWNWTTDNNTILASYLGRPVLRNQIDFGNQSFGPIEIDIKLTSIDGLELKILDIRSSCTCVRINENDSIPSPVQLLRMRINPKMRGRFTQRIMVVFDRRENSLAFFTITGSFLRGDSNETISG